VSLDRWRILESFTHKFSLVNWFFIDWYNWRMDNSPFIYFDVGNTLVDCSNYFKTATTRFNLKADDIKKIFNENHDPVTKGFLTPQQFWEKCIQRYNIKNAQDYDFLESWVSDYEPIAEMHEVILKLKSKYHVGLLSNIYKGMLPLLLEKGLIPNIDYDQIIFSCDVGMMKSNPDIYSFAQKKANTNPKNILLIDDRQDFLDEAKKAGWQIFLFNSKQRVQSTKKLEKYLQNL
jgi:HAD superfamily hydrolase (TIGR01509 family)